MSMMQGCSRLSRLPGLLHRYIQSSTGGLAATNVELRRKVATAQHKQDVTRTNSETAQNSSGQKTFTSAPKVTLSSSAVNKMKNFDPATDGYLRLVVDGGGCAGFTSRFELDKQVNESEDYIIEQDGVRLIVDQASIPFINGSVIDFQHELIRSGFRILTNPNAEKRCSCGTSFSLKEG